MPRLHFPGSRAVRFSVFASLILAAAGHSPAVESADDSEAVDFARQIRPILADHCYACHGPDEADRQAGLRLDVREPAVEDLGGYRAIDPGDAGGSELVIRLHSDDPDSVMPPPETGKPLTDEEKELLARWIDQGAEYAEHWAFVPPSDPSIPTIDPGFGPPRRVDAATAGNTPSLRFPWARGPLDAFVADKLSDLGLHPSVPADLVTRVRRVTLDLIGLPPTEAEIERVMREAADENDSLAYARHVDRLLASPHFGERWGRVWLDAARYADSDGYEKDKPRRVYFYRDWVIDSLNRDMPYDDFVVRQIAGDLLQGATQDDRVATGFLRNSMVNEEGGVDPEQFRMEAIYDRMDAIGKSVLGLTIQCAQCHSHKYDPLSHTDYYRMFAMLNNCHEASIAVYDEGESARRVELDDWIADLLRELQTRRPELRKSFEQYAERIRRIDPEQIDTPEIDWIETTISGQKYFPQSDGSYLAQGYAPTQFNPEGTFQTELSRVDAIRIDVLTDANLPRRGPGRSPDGRWALSEVHLEVWNEDKRQYEKVAWGEASATVDPPVRSLKPFKNSKKNVEDGTTGPSSFAIDGDAKTAWTSDPSPGRQNRSERLLITFKEPIETVHGQPRRFKIGLEQRHGGGNSDDNQTLNLGRFRISLVGPDVAATSPVAVVPPDLERAVGQSSSLADVDADQRQRLFDHFLRTTRGGSEATGTWSESAAADVEQTLALVDTAWAEYPNGDTQLVVEERDELRPTHRLDRGDFLSPRERVDAGFPGFLQRDGQPVSVDGVALNRLSLAKWLTDDQSPTTARSIVNRVWQGYFGSGLTATVDDLGLQGEPPTHVELLDHLAIGLIRHGWNLKWLHREIVTSQTYGQSSRVTDELLTADPDNRFFARGPRGRTPAETVRDIALDAAGLLDHQIGGAPVHPPAPEFLFVPPASYGPKSWETDPTRIYRRGIYTFRFRSVPYPVYQAFDAPTGEVACVRRNRSNTPIQALVTLNEPMFLECARNLAKVSEASAETTSGQITTMFRRVLSRTPETRELRLLMDLYQSQRESGGQDASRLSPLATVARVILNLDEAITKP